MEYSVQAYLRRVPTQTLIEFLEKYRTGELREEYDITQIVEELARREQEEEK